MKKVILLIVLVVGLFALKPEVEETIYPENLSRDFIHYLHKEFVKEMNNETLNEDIQSKFWNLFDKVSDVNAHYSQVNGFYYVVFGSLDGVDKIEMLKIEESDMQNEIYSYIDFSNYTVTSETVYCKAVNGFPPPVCQGGCKKYTDASTCLGLVCSLPGCDQP